MAITKQELTELQSEVNARLAAHKAAFFMSVHFSLDRVNDPRNHPPITIEELKSIFHRLIDQHLVAIVALNDRDTFTIKCGTSDINMPCGVEKVNAKNSSLTQKNIVITVMRKKDFFSKDRVVFVV